MDKMHLLVTGGCGFIGTNFIRHMLSAYPYRITNLDKLTYAGNLENLKEIENNPNYRFVKGDIADIRDLEEVFSETIDVIVNFAAESHVDRSILDADAFVTTNIAGTHRLIETARKKGVEKFVQISTDEVYGSLGPTGKFTEETPLSPRSPYSASKASADMLALSYFHTFGMPILITRCSNNYGPFQFPEKLIPLLVTNALEGKSLPIYGDGLNVRDWIHVIDHCRAIDLILQKGMLGETYCVGGLTEDLSNLAILKKIIKLLGKTEDSLEYVKDRPGHDRRYALDWSKIKRELGWQPLHNFDEWLGKTVKWYQENDSWWKNVKNGEYKEYYQKQYSK